MKFVRERSQFPLSNCHQYPFQINITHFLEVISKQIILAAEHVIQISCYLSIINNKIHKLYQDFLLGIAQ